MGDESEEINYLGILGSHKCKRHENDETYALEDMCCVQSLLIRAVFLNKLIN